MNLRKPILLIAALALFLTPQNSEAQVSEGVAAIVNDRVISTYDVRQRMRLMILSTQTQPTEESLLRFQSQAIRSLIDESLKLQEAEKYEIAVTDAEVNQQIARLARQNDANPEKIKADLRKANISPRTLEDQMRADIAWQILINGRYGTRIRVSNNQIQLEKQRFEENLAQPQFLISEILLESPSIEQDSAIYAGGLSLIEQMQAGAPFPAVAQQFSAAPSAQQGGDVGWIRHGDMPPEVNAVLAQMQVGTVSNPIKVASGFYIIAMRDRKKGGAPIVANFRQIVAPPQSMDQLVSFLETTSNCEQVDAIPQTIEGAFVNPFDNVNIADLAPAFRDILQALQANQWSKPMDTPNGAVSIMLCSKGYEEGAGIPTSDEIVNRLTDQKLGMMSRRYLRDLRRDSTIEYRN